MLEYLALFQPIWQFGRKVRVYLPGAKKSTKVRWRLAVNVDLLVETIDRALIIPRDDDYNLYLDLKSIYNTLGKYGVPMPSLGPSDNPTWRQYHFNFLYLLRRRLKNNNFDLEEWENWVDLHESTRDERIEEIQLDCKILKFLCELEKENRPVTNRDVYA